MTAPLPPPTPQRYRHPEQAARQAVEDAALAAYVAGKRAAESAMRLPPPPPSGGPSQPPPPPPSPAMLPPVAQTAAPPPAAAGVGPAVGAPTPTPSLAFAEGGEMAAPSRLLPGVVSADDMFAALTGGNGMMRNGAGDGMAMGSVDSTGGGLPDAMVGDAAGGAEPDDGERALLESVAQGPPPPPAFVTFITSPAARNHADELVRDLAVLVESSTLSVQQAYGLLRAAAADEDGLAADVTALLGSAPPRGGALPPPPPGMM